MPMAATSKFTSNNFSDASVEIWNPDHIRYGRGFECERAEFREFWQSRIPRDIRGKVCQCWVITEGNALVGYITLLADKLEKPRLRGGLKPLLTKEGIGYTSFPAVKIGLLATDMNSNGAGSRLVEWALDHIATEIPKRVGVRFVTVDALYDADTNYDASLFYLRFGFKYVNPNQKLPPDKPYRTMYFDILEFENEIRLAEQEIIE